jgi:ABC-type bacteriocin/lantibiotic exporter with double-glycine peptidase domain
MAAYSPLLTLAFLATTPLYAGLMIFPQRCCARYHGVEESQKYSSHQIDAIKGIEAVKAASAEGAFRDAMLNEFLSVSQKLFKSTFIVMSWDSLLQTVGCSQLRFFSGSAHCKSFTAT